MDTRAFARSFTAYALVGGALLLAIGSFLDPAWADDADEYLQEVADAKGRYLVAGILETAGALLMIFGLLGVAKLLRRRRGITFGQVAATMAAIGMVGLSAALLTNSVDIVLTEAENREAAAAIFDDFEDSTGGIIYFVFFFFAMALLGTLLLGISLLIRRVVPIWGPIVLIAGMVFSFIGGENAVGAGIGALLIAIGLVPLAQKILSLTPEEWGDWAPLDGVTAPPGAVEPAMTPTEPILR